MAASFPRQGSLLAAAALVASTTVVTVGLGTPAVEAVTDPNLCYVVPDTGGGNGGNDRLVTFNRTTGAFVAVGGGTGTNDIEAADLWPATDTLYAIDADELGTIDLTTGVYSTVGPKFGTLRGAAGNQVINDADGMTLDPFEGFIWASERNRGADYIFKINRTTGVPIPNAFGPGIDYVVSTPAFPSSPDLDDIAMDPSTGVLYGIANSGSSVPSQRLVTIDKLTGEQTLIGPLGEADMEGLTFTPFGLMFGTDGTNNELFEINPATGAATNGRPIPIGGDYESVSCLTGPPNQILGNVFLDENVNGVDDGIDTPQAGAVVELIIDTNGNGIVDPGEQTVGSTTTAADGSYQFDIASQGDFIVRISNPSLPAGAVNTTPKTLAVNIAAPGTVVTDQDFGFFAPPPPPPPPPLSIDKNNEPAGEVQGGDTVSYTIVVTNNSDVPQTGVDVQDTIPPGVTYVPDSTRVILPGAGAMRNLRDEFTAPEVYTGDDGNLPWAGPWQEFGDNNDAKDGDVFVDDKDCTDANTEAGCLVFDSKDTVVSVVRGADLSTALSPVLTYRIFAKDEIKDGGLLSVEVTGDGTNWTTLTTYNSGSPGKDNTLLESFPLPGGVLTPNFQLRYITNNVGQVAKHAIDNVDIAWTDPNAGAIQDVLDEFNTEDSYAGDDGTVPWGSSWTEVGDDSDPSGGDIRAIDNSACDDIPGGSLAPCLRYDAKDDANSLARSVDLSTAIAPVELSYNWFNKGEIKDGQFVVEVSGDGTNFTPLVTYTDANAPKDGTGNESFTLDPGVLTSGFTLRLRSELVGGELDFAEFFMDDFKITWTEPSGGDGGPPPGLLGTIPPPTLLPGESVIVTFDVTIDAAENFPLMQNTATTTSVEQPIPISDSVANTLAPATAELALAKTIDPDPPVLGETVTYVVTLTNNGPDTATGVKINESPPGVLAATFLPAADTEYDVNNNQWKVPQLASGESTTLTVIGTATATGDYTNTASITESESADPDPNNNVATVVAEIPPTADLSIEKELVGGPAFFPGDAVEFNVVLTNDGPDAATNVTVEDAIPAGAGGAPTVSPTLGTYAGSTWTIPSIDPGTSATLNVVGVATGNGDFINTAEVTASDQVDPDSTPGDDVPEQDDQDSVAFQVVDTTADLAVTKIADTTTLVVGEVVTFTIEVTNNGPDDATNIEIAEALGPNFSDDSIVLESLGVYASSIDTWFIDELAVGTTATLTIEALTVLDGSVTNTASVQALDQNDPDPTNDSESVDVTIDPFIPNPLLVLTKTASPTSVLAVDDVITYSFSVENTGNVDVTDIVIADPRLPGLTCDPIALLAPGESSAVTCTAGNTYTVTQPDIDTNGGGDADIDNSATATGTDPSGNDVTAIGSAEVSLPAQVGDFVWLDLNNDGIQDPGEPGYEGATVNLLDAGGNIVDTAVTGSSGAYVFTVAPGDYRIVITGARSEFSPQDAGTDDVDSDVNASGSTGLLTLVPGPNFDVGDAGIQSVSIGDFVWRDLDGNGIQDAGEPGIDGVTVNLYADDGTTLLDTTTTTAGIYEFPGLTPGVDYVVEVVRPDAGVFTTADQGTDDRVDSDVDANGRVAVTPIRACPAEFTALTLVAADAPTVFPTSTFAGGGSQTFGGNGAIENFDASFANGQSPFPPHPDWTGNVRVRVEHLDPANPNSNAFHSWFDDPSVRVTSLSDFNWNNLQGDGGQVYRVFGRGSFFTSPVTSVSYTLDFTGMSLGYLPAGTHIAFTDIDGPADGENWVVSATGPFAALAPFLTLESSSVTSNPQAPLDFDPVTGTYNFDSATPSSNGSVAYVASENLTSVTLVVDQPAGASTSFKTFAPIDCDNTLDGADAGILPVAVIGDLVFLDVNGDGIQDAGDVGLPGVVVELLDDNGAPVLDAAGDPITATTDTDGRYTITVAPGDYQVRVNPPTGATFSPLDQGGDDAGDSDVDPGTGTTATFTATFGENFDVGDAGVISASIGDFVYLDLNDDGVQDAGEPGIEGVTVELLDANGDVVDTQVTDADGLYTFDGLAPGVSYTVQVTAPTGGTFVAQDQGGDDAVDSDVDATGVTAAIVPASGPNPDVGDAGISPASIGDFVYLDLNGDGVQDAGEPGLEGVTVELLDANGDVVDTQVTDTDGLYTFDGVAPGVSYTVQVTAPGGATFAPQDAGGDDAVDSDVDATGVTASIVPASGPNPDVGDAGVLPASLGDFVFLDLDGDGVQDAGEPGIEGVTVQLLDANGDVIDTRVTDENGAYNFTGIQPGSDYAVQVVPPTGAQFSPQDAGGDDTVDSDVDATGLTGTIAGATAGTDAGDAGILPASIGDFVYLDLNDDGVQDAGEPGIEGVTVELLDANGDVVDTQVTDANGAYSFDGLVPGAPYTVQVTPPAGGTFVAQDQGGDDTVDSDVDASGVTGTITPPSGDNFDVGDAGVSPASIGDFVYLDLDGDGVQDAGEPGIEGVTVELLDANGDVVDTQVTDANGAYSFDGLVPGAPYTVQVTPPGGGTFVPQDAGGDDTIDSDVDASGVTGTITPLSGDNFDVADAGILPTSIGDLVFLDIDGDGAQDPADPGIEGITVQLLDANGVVIDTQVTDADGLYSFDGLQPGASYRVQVVPPTGATFSPPDTVPDSADSDVDPSGLTPPITPGATPNLDAADAGILPASIGDFVYLDLDEDGIQNGGEPGIPGVTVQLIDENGAVADTQVTGPDGEYSFDGLVPGVPYTVQVTQPAGGTFSPQDQGGDDTVDSDVDATGVTGAIIPASGDNPDVGDAGVLPSTLGNYVFVDVNGDGVQDPGDQGIPGLTVNLLDDNGDVIDTTTTGPQGNYLFGGLVPGVPVTVQVVGTSLLFVPADLGGDEALDSDVDAAGLVTVSPASGTNDDAADAGVVPATIGDFVFLDLNGDGVQDTGEPGIEGVTVFLLDAAGSVIDSTSTDAAGRYTFTGVTPTVPVTVRVVAPDATFSPTDAGGDDALDSDVDVNGEVAVTPASGDDPDVGDAGILPATIGDFVFLDLNGDGIQDPGEAGIEGVTVTLLDDNGGVVDTTTTDADGSYSFVVAPGDYEIRVTPPTGATFSPADSGDDALDSDVDAAGSTGVFTAPSGDNSFVGDAGIVPATLGDFVFVDLNEDGIQDAGEPGIEGITVNLLDDTGAVVDSTTTDADGLYEFTGVTPGTSVTIQVIDPNATFSPTDAGGDDVTDSDVDASGEVTVTPVSGDNSFVGDAGILPAIIGDFVFNDGNGDGIQDPGEAGAGGVTVNLLDDNGDVVDTTTTAPDGSYSFSVAPGDYQIQVVAPNGTEFGPQGAGGDPALDSDVDPATGLTNVFTAPSGDHTDVGDASLLAATIGDFVFLDLDGDGTQGVGEPGLEGVTVNLLDANGAVIDTTATDATGSYSFSVAPGDYQIEVIAPNGATFSPQDVGGDDLVDSDVDATGTTAVFNAVSGDNTFVGDAGILPATIGDFVFLDLNGDGVQDGGEPGIEGVVVELLDANGSPVLDANGVAVTTTTDVDGAYSLTVAPGDYQVRVTPPIGSQFSPQDAGGDDTTDSDVDATGTTAVFNATSGDNPDVGDAGMLAATLNGTIWLDSNEDGVRDPGEPGIPGRTVNVLDANDNVIGTAVTDDDGNYTIPNLPPSVPLTVELAPLTGADLTAADQGGDELLDSDFDPTLSTVAVTLASGDNTGPADGGILPATLSDVVFLDVDDDGVESPSDPPLGGINVNLLDANGDVIDTTTTGPDGRYEFTDVIPGVPVTVEVVVPGVAPTIIDADQGNDDTLDSDVDPVTGRLDIVPVSGVDTEAAAAGVRPASVGDYVWLDVDLDGVQDPDEPGVEGVLVTVVDGNGVEVGTAVTGPDGAWEVFGLPPNATFTVQLTPAPGATFVDQGQGADRTLDSDVAADGTVSVETLKPRNIDEADAGIQPATVEGVIFIDRDADGINDPEDPGAPGQTVNVLDDEGNLVATVVTLDDGSYSVPGLFPGVPYTVEVVRPGDAAFSPQDQGGDEANDSDVDPGTGTTSITPISGVNVGTTDAGISAPSVSGSTWTDLNGDGVRDNAELPLAGIPVELIDSNGDVVATTTTLDDGTYVFDGVLPGDYVVSVDPSGVPGVEQTGDPDTTFDDSTPITVDLGQSVTDLDFGYQPEALLEGIVFADLDGDGVQDPDEPGLPGAQLTIVDADGNEVTVTSDDDGNYSTSVRPGPASITIDPGSVPAGFLNTTDNVSQTVDTQSGETATADPIGYQPQAQLSGTIYFDVDVDGAIDPVNEPSLEGVVLELVDLDGNVIDTTTTDADGDYSFEGIGAGDYRVRVVETTLPNGLSQNTIEPDDGEDAAGSGFRFKVDEAGISGTGPDPAALCGLEVSALNRFFSLSMLTAGATSLDGCVFAFTGTATLGDFVFVDDNRNGLPDPGEAGVAGVGLTATWAGFDGEFGTDDDIAYPPQISASDGSYRFSNLPTGSYRVDLDRATLPGNIDVTTATSFQFKLGAGQQTGLADIGLRPVDMNLPPTGGQVGRTVGLGAALLALGFALLAVRRRRQGPARLGDGAVG